MFSKRVITSLVALGLLATGGASAFADDTTTGTSTGTSTDTAVTTSNQTDAEDAKKDSKKDKKKDKVKDKQLDRVCMQAVVEKRDNAVIATLDTYHANVKTALLARRDALKAAWGIEDREARKEAIRKAWNDFQGTWKKERRALNTARKAAWKQFAEDKRNCGGEGEGEDQGKDKNL